MSEHGKSSRVSTRPNKGVPPLRFPAPETTNQQQFSCGDNSSKKSASKSVKTSSTVKRQREVEIAARKETLGVNERINAKTEELKLSEVKAASIERRIQQLGKDDDSNSEEWKKKMQALVEAKLDCEEEVERLKVHIDSLNKNLITIDERRNIELDELESDDEDDAASGVSSEEKEKESRLRTWLEEHCQGAPPRTPLNRTTADATNCKVVGKPQETADETSAKTPITVLPTPVRNEPVQQPETKPKPPVYIHERHAAKKAATHNYDSESEGDELASDLASVIGSQSGENVIRALTKAIQGMSAGQGGSHVVMKTTVDKDLPKFSGEPEHWIQFKTEFERTTKKYKFDDSENLTRLRKALTGQAKNTVQHMMANVANVPVIMDALEKRFGRPRLVLSALAAKAKQCGNVSRAKPDSIIEFGLAVQALVSNVVSFKEDGYLNSVELLDTLIKKLSPDLASSWFEWLASDKKRENNLIGFSEWSTLQLDIAYQRADYKPEEKSEEKSDRRHRRGPGVINISTSDDGKCICCGKGNHSLDKCFSFKKKSLDNRWKICKENNVCLSCLKPGHRSKNCDGAKLCGIDGCERVHHRYLHNERKKPEVEKMSADKGPNGNEQSKEEVGKIAVITGCDGPMSIVPVRLLGPTGTYRTYALLDGGASRTLILRRLAEQLGLEGEPHVYRYRGISGELLTENNSKKVDCQVSGVMRGSKYSKLQGAVTVEEIRMRPYSMDVDEIKIKYPYLNPVAAKNLNKVVPELIIGNNNPRLFLSRKILERGADEPIGWRCELGWAISGNFDNFEEGVINVIRGEGRVSNDELHQLVKRSFSFEDFGVKAVSRVGKNLEEKRAYEILEKTTKKIGNCWETGLLWREDDISFPESYTAALRRLEYTEKKMKDPAYRSLYCNKVSEYADKSYLRKIISPAVEKSVNDEYRSFIIPHFGVTNPNKPGKFRLVLDAKAKTNGVSLNDKLLKGPDLIRSLVGVLWCFRRHQIALTGDISDMFHRVRIRKEDQAFQRILWRDGDSSRTAELYQMEVMIFGSTSSPSSAIFVKDKNASLFNEMYPSAVQVILSDFYVDDCLTGGETEEQVIALRQQLTEICDAGNFQLCKWMSNSKKVLESVPEDLRTEGTKNLQDKEDLPGERVLGMWWNSTEDVFQFQLGLHKVRREILEGDIPTKREMCGLIMSLFDPIGFISHYKVKGLILLQEVWASGVGWDDEIPVAIYLKWKSWLQRLEEVKLVRVPRCYSSLLVGAQNIQLHTFVDSSSEAFSAICYLRIRRGDQVEISFVSAKARVAPIKKTTIPRLELQAALMGSRLARAIQNELGICITSRYFWSDSSTVLQWLSSRAGKLKEFVANRVVEIQEDTNLEEWHWIPTKLNISDQATRYESEISFSPDSEWYKGPAFLLEDPETWNFEEERKKAKECGVIALATEVSGDGSRVSPLSEGCGLELGGDQLAAMALVPKPERFSSYGRLIRATAAVCRAANHWIGRYRRQESMPPWELNKDEFISNLTAEDLLFAENAVLQLVQTEAFGPETNILRNGGQLKRKGRLWRLSPIVGKDGLLRVQGRIVAAEGVVSDTKFPIILPPRHVVTDLLVDQEHVRFAHQGIETVLASLRQRFWIIDARHVVKRSWKRCQVCCLANSKPFAPKMGNLPSFRLASRQLPFTFCGLDLFGPMEVTVGRHHEKRWGVLFCCMVTRAVHLEVVHSLSTDEIILALSRFVDVRGRPQQIHSDNGTNFVGASRELRRCWETVEFAKVQECGKFQQILWTFNPPGAPHMGGAWERLIQIVKKCLTATLNEKYPKDTTLLTLLKAAENMVNSRPLTYLSSDPTDPAPITPNHLLRGGCDAGPSVPAVMDARDEFLRLQWRRSQVLADQFWERWTKDYLPKLVRREKWQEPTEPIKVGALVFIVDELLPRNCWVRGYVSRVFPGEDGHVRSVEVKTKKGGKETTYRRPVVKICPLGLHMEIKEPEDP